MNFLRNFLLCLFLSFSVICESVYAHEGILRQYVKAYNEGSVEDLPFAFGATENSSESALVDHSELFERTTDRALILSNVRWSPSRITSDYSAKVDGHGFVGSLTLYISEGKITRLVHDSVVWPESESNIADLGQALDKGTTTVGLATGMTEANPLLAGITPLGAVALGVGIIAARNTVVRELPLSECIKASRAISVFGWGPGVANLAVMAGAGPIGWAFGAGAAITSWNAEYKGSCVDGSIRAVSIQ